MKERTRWVHFKGFRRAHLQPPHRALIETVATRAAAFVPMCGSARIVLS
ncbi:hypothetical protein I553_10402 [Mycobacterium xenopi 4042]|uniref:Uncharacterized protein n=1 Tax=Mycobacterium xenopi 4042 TaxID=1299334 RepID=X7ZKM7_MYCXE|nr:hypothetical protein I553_10402 [Mycobacterium xenopi 4042]EUA24687.1 hypothetical protein I552_3431 [Mycobacterium xenopi 3993]